METRKVVKMHCVVRGGLKGEPVLARVRVRNNQEGKRGPVLGNISIGKVAGGAGELGMQGWFEQGKL